MVRKKVPSLVSLLRLQSSGGVSVLKNCLAAIKTAGMMEDASDGSKPVSSFIKLIKYIYTN